MQHNAPRRVFHRLLLAGYLLVLLNGCAIDPRRSEMDALFPTPPALFADALGQEGWLGGGVDHLMLHQHLRAPEGTVVLYSGYDRGRLVVGSADAKSRAGRWYVHGMFQLAVPPLSGTQRISCMVMHYESSGASVAAVTGRKDLPEVHRMVAVFDSGTTQVVTMRDDIFMLLQTEPGRLRELRAMDAAGAVVERIPARACPAAS